MKYKLIDSVNEVEQINTFLNDIPGKIVTFLVVNKDFEYSIYDIKNYIVNGGKEPAEAFAKFVSSLDRLVKQGIILKNEKNQYSVNKQDPVIHACFDLNVALKNKMSIKVYEKETENPSSDINLSLETIEAINRFIIQKKTCLDDDRAFVLMSILYGMNREFITDDNISNVIRDLKGHQITIQTGGGNAWIQRLVKDGYIKMTFNFELDKTVYASTEDGEQFFEKYKLKDSLCL